MLKFSNILLLYLFGFSCSEVKKPISENHQPLPRDKANQALPPFVFIASHSLDTIFEIVNRYSKLASSTPYNSIIGTPFSKKIFNQRQLKEIKTKKNTIGFFKLKDMDTLSMLFQEVLPIVKPNEIPYGGRVCVSYLIFCVNDFSECEKLNFKLSGNFYYDAQDTIGVSDTLTQYDDFINLQSHAASISLNKGPGIYIYDMQSFDRSKLNRTISYSNKLDYSLDVFISRKKNASITIIEPILIGTYWK